MKRKSDIMKICRIETALLLLVAVVFSTGCKKVFDIKPKDTLDQSQMYQNVYDADAAVLGIYGKFMGLADRYVILNELRADLLDCTQNAIGVQPTLFRYRCPAFIRLPAIGYTFWKDPICHEQHQKC